MIYLDPTKIRLTPLMMIVSILSDLFWFITYRYLYNTYFHLLYKFPGPFWGRMKRLWLTYHNIRSTKVAAEYKLHKRYGIIYSCLHLQLFEDKEDFYRNSVEKSSCSSI